MDIKKNVTKSVKITMTFDVESATLEAVDNDINVFKTEMLKNVNKPETQGSITRMLTAFDLEEV